jgi:hypothetical protein
VQAGQTRERRPHRVSRAELLLLHDGPRGRGDRGEVLTDGFPAGPHDDEELLRCQLLDRGEDVAEQGAVRDLVQHLGLRRAHPGALTGREDDDGSRAVGAHCWGSCQWGFVPGHCRG